VQSIQDSKVGMHEPSGTERVPPQRLVRVWFGHQVVVRYEGDAVEAVRYEQAMCRRFPAGRVTNEPAGGR